MCVDSGRALGGPSSVLSASRKESTDLLLRRKGARRWKCPGEQGICTRALWEGTTVSPGDSQGGTLVRMLRSSSGENTGLSIPRREAAADQRPGSPLQDGREGGCCLGARHQPVLQPPPARSPGRSGSHAFGGQALLHTAQVTAPFSCSRGPCRPPAACGPAGDCPTLT